MIKKIGFVFLFTCNVVFGGAFDTKSIASDFRQTIINEEGKKLYYSGKFYMQKGRRSLWEYKKPTHKKIFFNNIKSHVVVIEPDLEQAIITKISETINFENIVNGATKTDDGRYMTTFGDVDYYIHVKDDKIDKITYTDKLDNRVKIEFKNSVYDEKIKAEIMDIEIPKGYDIIEQ